MAEKSCKFGLLRSGAQPIADGPIQDAIFKMNVGDISRKMYAPDVTSKFLASYDAWIKSSTMNQIKGLDGYGRYMTFAITHAIEQFLMQHRDKRIRTFKGEYPGTSELISGYGLNHLYIDDGEIKPTDAVIMSVPFSGSGNQHPLTAEILEICKHEQVPVMIDCAFFGMCKGIDIQANSSVQMIAFSLSKCYHLDSHRIGMIYSNVPPSGIEVLNRFGYTSRFGATIALELFDRFGPDYIYSKYSRMQHRICETLDHMTPSDTVIFGNGNSNWSMFDRGGIHNRISFGSFISNVNDTSF